ESGVLARRQAVHVVGHHADLRRGPQEELGVRQGVLHVGQAVGPVRALGVEAEGVILELGFRHRPKGGGVMPVVLLLLLSLLSWPALATPPAAAPSTSTQVRIVDTWPPAEDGYLPRNQSFHVRLAYRSDTPVGIWLRPMYQGQSANAGSNPSARYLGEGEAL